MKKIKEKFDVFFGIKESGSSFKVEIIAGIATFLAMSYILIVNPNQILYGGSSDPSWASLFIATAFGAIIGTLLMSLYAKMPLAQASGMGLNSTLGGVIGGGLGFYAYNIEYSLANAHSKNFVLSRNHSSHTPIPLPPYLAYLLFSLR